MLARNLDGTNRVSIEGMEAFQRSFPDGRVEVVVPALNFWVVDRTTLGGSRTRFHDIKSEKCHIKHCFFLLPGSQ